MSALDVYCERLRANTVVRHGLCGRVALLLTPSGLSAGMSQRCPSFGTQSACGSRFVERVMTVIATLKQQKRNVLEYLQSVCSAQIRGEEAPSLLPNPINVSQPTV